MIVMFVINLFTFVYFHVTIVADCISQGGAMLRLRVLLMLLILCAFYPAAAQDGLNLPTELYTLLNEGRVERYGLGAAGVARVTPDDEVVIDFGVAPDGIWLAYRTESGLTLRNMLTAETRQLEATTAGIPPFRGRGQTIAWSPDGAVLSYTTDYGLRFAFEDETFFDITITPLLHLSWSPDSRFLAAEAENNIWWIYRREGSQMILTSAIPSSLGLDWVGNGLLMFAPEQGGLFLMDVSSGNAQSKLHEETMVFRQPVYRQNGTVVVFARPMNDTTLNATSGYLYQVVPSGGEVTVEQVSQVAVDLDGLRWSPGGNLLLALRGGVLGLVDPASGQGFTLPVTGVATYGWGAVRPASAVSLPLTDSGYFVADDGTGIRQLWRLAPDAARAAPLAATPENVETFAVAPDGQTIVYYSAGQLWLLPANAETATSIAEIETVNNLTFSADGLLVAYDDGSAIYTLPITGGEPQILLTGYTQPQYSPDGSAVLVRIGDGDMGLLMVTSGEVRRLGAFTWAKWLRDGRVVSYGAPTGGGQNGVYLSDPRTDAAPALLYGQPVGTQSVDAVLLANGSVRVLQTRAVDAPAPLEVVDITDSVSSSPVNVGFIGRPTLSQDGRFIAGYANATGAIVTYDIDLKQEVLLTNPPGVLQFRWG
jgi:hypothetical protein